MEIEKGQVISCESIQQLMLSQRPARNDFRKAIIFICTAVAISLYVLNSHNGTTELLGLAIFPFIIGTGYFIAHKYTPIE